MTPDATYKEHSRCLPWQTTRLQCYQTLPFSVRPLLPMYKAIFQHRGERFSIRTCMVLMTGEKPCLCC